MTIIGKMNNLSIRYKKLKMFSDEDKLRYEILRYGELKIELS